MVLETHPVQYRAPIYRTLQQRFGIPVTVVYGSDFSVVGYRDSEFQTEFSWDTDLLSGYESVFLSRVTEAGARSVEEVSAHGLKEALHKLAPEVALMVGYGLPFYRAAFWHLLGQGVPILFRGETTDHARKRGRVLRWFRGQVLRGMYKRCARLLYIGQRSYQHFRRLGVPEEKLLFSPYGVDTAPFQWDEASRAQLRPVARQRLGLTQGQRVLLFSGKLSQRKGPKLILEAIRRLPREVRREIAVLWMGDGEERQALEEQTRQLPEVKSVFLGFQNQSRLSSYYHAADLLVLPSLHSETWGLVVNEALHHGLPCVVSETVGCAPDLIQPGATGEICQTGSADGLEEALQRAFALVNREDVRKQCREKVGGFTLEKAAEGIARAYRDVVGKVG